jgi:hypothetical protein
VRYGKPLRRVHTSAFGVAAAAKPKLVNISPSRMLGNTSCST